MRKHNAHELVWKTAQDMAFALYEEVMSGNNDMYASWKNVWPELKPEERQRRFCQLIAPKLLEPARAILASMLSDPSKAHLHEAIYDSMILDNAVRASRVAPAGRPHLHLDGEGNVKNVTRN